MNDSGQRTWEGAASEGVPIRLRLDKVPASLPFHSFDRAGGYEGELSTRRDQAEFGLTHQRAPRLRCRAA